MKDEISPFVKFMKEEEEAFGTKNASEWLLKALHSVLNTDNYGKIWLIAANWKELLVIEICNNK